jgi:hypothetical protein
MCPAAFDLCISMTTRPTSPYSYRIASTGDRLAALSAG